MTVIGSSNFSSRSNRRDTEAMLYIVPECDKFKRLLHDERNNLWSKSEQMSIESLMDKSDKEYKITWKDKIINKLFNKLL